MQGQPPQQGYGQAPQQQGYGQAPQQGYGHPGGAPGPVDPAKTPAIIMLVCAVLLLIAMVTKGWAGASEGRFDIGAGLFGFEGCRGGECESMEWDRAAKRLDIPSDVSTFRILGMIAGFLAIGGMAAAGGMALSGNLGKIPVKPIQGIMGAAAGSLTYFAMRLWMSDDDVNFGPSWGAFVGIGGLIGAGVVLRTKLAPLVEAAAGAMPQQGWAGAPQQQQWQQAPQAPQQQWQQPQAAAPQQQAQQTYPCQTCQQPLQYVAQYQRYYCATCQKYV